MISIVLPTYNGEKYIKYAIDSIINQTYSNWELIVIDDCSTDSTCDIVKEYVKNDSRIFLYNNKENLKLPKSLNVGFRKSKGEYLTWTSDDNIYKPNALEVLLSHIETDENIGLVFSKMDYIDENGMKKNHVYSNVDIDSIYYKNIVGASFLYTREVYCVIGEYNIDKFLMEDYDYWYRIYRKFKIKYIDESLYKYRQHSNSLTESKNDKVLEAKVKLLEERIDPNIDKNILIMIYKELAESYFSLNKYDKMKAYIKKMKNISKDISMLRKSVIYSFYLGENISKILKFIFKKFKYILGE